MRRRLEIRELGADPGQRTTGYLTVGETASGPLTIPLAIINGRTDGPILCLTAGVHATEYAPIDAVMRVVQELDPAELAGAVLAVPIANLRMFEARSPFVSPLDRLNLNKVGGGHPDGSSTEILAHVLLDEIISLAGCHIDLHAGDLGEMLLPFAGYALSGRPDQDHLGETLARLYTPRLVSLARPGGPVPPFGDALSFAASAGGIVSIFAESGGNGTLEEADVAVHLAGIRNVMRHLGMMPGRPEPAPGPRLAARDRVVVRARRAGLLHLGVAIGDEIQPGQEVARIKDPFGAVVERVQAGGAGIAGLVWAHKAVNAGDPIVRYWIVDPA